jgi:hypothetical protein
VSQRMSDADRTKLVAHYTKLFRINLADLLRISIEVMDHVDLTVRLRVCELLPCALWLFKQRTIVVHLAVLVPLVRLMTTRSA